MQQKIRYSKKREAILTTLQSTKTHPNAEWVLAQLKPEYPDLSLGTVYRNLSFFKEQGNIISVGVVNGQERFDATTTPHSHFICEDCGSVIDVLEVDALQEITPAVTQSYGFTVARQELVLYGTCKDCNNISHSAEVAI
ncbi:MAG: transcriptional repressor [Eubacteriales bacterium]